jgi:hypothetical protein
MHESVGSFAENVINNDFQLMKEGNSASPSPNVPPQLAESQRDIRSVKVPDSFVKLALGESYENVEDIKEESKATFSANPSESPQVLLDKLSELIAEARKVIEEMTTVGSIGVNMAGPEKKKRQNNPHAICTSQKKKSGMDHAAWRRCVSHVKGKK